MTWSAGLNLPVLVLSRVGASTIFMTYPACLLWLQSEWNMSASQAGLLQGAFTAAFAVSLLVSSIKADKHGSRRIFIAANVATAAAALLFALFARDFASAFVLLVILGLAQGGTYTPAIMLVSENTSAEHRGAAVGWVLAGMSAGYVISIVLATYLTSTFSYQTAFLACAALASLCLPSGWLAVRGVKQTFQKENEISDTRDTATQRDARLLTIGYVGHCWELFGVWAWVPAFMAASFVAAELSSPLIMGLLVSLSLHLSGFFSSFIAGYLGDRFGMRSMLILFAIAGGICSLLVGWMSEAGLIVLVVIVTLYGFVTIGDSSVLSAAMSKTVGSGKLGSALGVRSVLGIGAGALSPVVFGLVLDLTPDSYRWGFAFSSLAIGAAVAYLAARRLQDV